jgi:serine/threonine-protein kinase ULK/ATG1
MGKSLIGHQIRHFTLTSQIGEGAFAVVFQAVNTITAEMVAAKLIKQSHLKKSPKLQQLVRTEISVLKQCKNENVISYIDSFDTSQYLVIITEYCNGGDLETYIGKKGKLCEEEAVTFLRQILNGFKVPC